MYLLHKTQDESHDKGWMDENAMKKVWQITKSDFEKCES